MRGNAARAHCDPRAPSYERPARDHHDVPRRPVAGARPRRAARSGRTSDRGGPRGRRAVPLREVAPDAVLRLDAQARGIQRPGWHPAMKLMTLPGVFAPIADSRLLATALAGEQL